MSGFHKSGTSIGSVIRFWAEQSPTGIAVAGSGRSGLTYGELYAQVEHVIATLDRLGLGRNDRIAILVPRGPDLSACVLSVASAATAAPLNPACGANEFTKYLTAADIRAVIVKSGHESPAWEIAKAAGIPILRLVSLETGAVGLFLLESDAITRPRPPAGKTGFAEPEDIAFVLTTSGTTSRPKVVPLTQANVTISAQNIATSLDLSPEDRCLNMMPLFHGHGLIGGLLTSIACGGSVFSVTGPHAPQFFDWLSESKATWYTAVPTVHQAIAERALQGLSNVPPHSLRFIRSCSAALGPQLMKHLEQIFHVPVVEAYGITETSHQISINPLPPKVRKAGSAGLPTGVEVSIVDPQGREVAKGVKGEVVVRGATVVAGYENDANANRMAFADGSFRTGDQGYLDEEGYLFLTGRLKEIINRGAEKISPREVDEALSEHPAIAQALTFAIPHPRLGEEVAAVVVLRSGARVTEQEIREFAAQKLSNFKVPRKILFLSEIPKGPTGKPQRVGLASTLGLVPDGETEAKVKREFVAPRMEIERALAALWEQLLVLPEVGIDDDFFEMGGDSILAAELLDRISGLTGVTLPLVRFVELSTIAKQARAVEHRETPGPISFAVVLQPSGGKKPFFCVPPGADVSGFRELAQLLGNDRPFYALQAFGLGTGYSVERAADFYVNEIKSIQPTGPYLLGGHCAGGFATLQVARRLRAKGDDVALLAVVHPMIEAIYYHPVSSYLRKFGALDFKQKASYAKEKIAAFWSVAARKLRKKKSGTVGTPGLRNEQASAEQQINEQIHGANRLQWKRHLRTPYQGSVDLFLTETALDDLRPSLHPGILWGKIAEKGVKIHKVSGDHITVLRYPHVKALADQLRRRLDEVDGLSPKEIMPEPQAVQSRR